MINPVTQRYLKKDYLEHNPEWDIKDSPWKADRVSAILKKHSIKPNTLCEVGCGAGGVLDSLKHQLTDTHFTGYDIAPAAGHFWAEIKKKGITKYSTYGFSYFLTSNFFSDAKKNIIFKSMNQNQRFFISKYITQ